MRTGFAVGIWIILLFFIYPSLMGIASDIKVIRETVTQQAKECHNLDTMGIKNK